MDEVDVTLHPLKSELNFPIGAKIDLDLSNTQHLGRYIYIILITPKRENGLSSSFTIPYISGGEEGVISVLLVYY